MHLARRRVIVVVTAMLLAGCGAGAGSTSTADISAQLKTAIKDLHSSEAICSGADAKHAACDTASALVTTDINKLKSSAPNWAPQQSQVPAKDALTGATESTLDPAKSLTDTRVMRLLLERAQIGLGTPTPSLAHASALATLPAEYAKQLSVTLPPIAAEVTAASVACTGSAIEACEVELLIARSGVNRVRQAYGLLPVSPADAPIDAVLQPLLSDTYSSMNEAVAFIGAQKPIDPGAQPKWAAAAAEFSHAAEQLAH